MAVNLVKAIDQASSITKKYAQRCINDIALQIFLQSITNNSDNHAIEVAAKHSVKCAKIFVHVLDEEKE